MQTQTLQRQPVLSSALAEKLLAAVLFVVTGGLIYQVFSPYTPALSPVKDYLGRFLLIALLLAMTLLAHKVPSLQKHRLLLVGLTIMAVAVSFDYIFAVFLVKEVGVSDSTRTGFMLQKLNEFFVVVSVVVSLTLLSGGTLGSIYIQKGRLKLGLLVGAGVFLLAAVASPWLATTLFKAQDLTLERALPWAPVILVMVLANAAEEELLFRGLFLRKLQPFVGPFLANLLVVVVFTLIHNGAFYTSNNLIFLASTAPFALAWGYLMQKTNAIWASILFHAGMDIPIFLGIFSNM